MNAPTVAAVMPNIALWSLGAGAGALSIVRSRTLATTSQMQRWLCFLFLGCGAALHKHLFYFQAPPPINNDRQEYGLA